MKEQVFAFVAAYPGIRIRTIADELYISNLKAGDYLRELRNEGKVYSTLYSDPANMEYYDKWYVK